jgi:hypothetical protein
MVESGLMCLLYVYASVIFGDEASRCHRPLGSENVSAQVAVQQKVRRGIIRCRIKDKRLDHTELLHA